MKLSSIVKFFFLRVINMRALGICIMILFLMLILSSVAMAQGGTAKPSKTEAEAAWNAGQYETAYDHYNGLLLLYSRDPLYKYYAGACLVMLERDIPRASTLLASAINSSAGVKSVPDDVWFWYGRSLQMNGEFDQAAEAYERFIRTAGKKSAQEYEVQAYIDECLKGQGARGKPKALTDEGASVEPSFAKATEGAAGSKGQVTAEANLTPAEPLPEPQPELFSVPEEYNVKLRQVVMMQRSADSLKLLAQGIGKEDALKSKAESLEKDAAALQSEADSILASLEPHTEVEGEVEGEDSVLVYSIFEVRESPAYSEIFPIPVDKGAPAGLVYSIQLAAFRNPIKPELFKGLYPVYGRLKPENGVTYYYAGMFRTVEAARQALQPARASGFPDAFVIALMDDVQVSMERAALLEKEWSSKPLLRMESHLQERSYTSGTDTIPVGTLTFRAEVMRSAKPVKPDIIEKIQLLAGTRGLDIIKNSEGETVFLIGNFITFESAEDYVSLLVRNGYSTARVAAYVNTQEIPVEAAKELLKQLLND